MKQVTTFNGIRLNPGSSLDEQYEDYQLLPKVSQYTPP